MILKKSRLNFNYSYQLHFASLIAPNFLSLSALPLTSSSERLPRKIHLKKSYLALSWFNYLVVQPGGPSRKLTFWVLPSKRSLLTLQKAPMAHKTNSKEQFMFKFYFFKFKTSLTTPSEDIPASVNEALLVFYLSKKTFPFFETNLLFIKYYQINSLYTDTTFFNFYNFTKFSAGPNLLDPSKLTITSKY